VYSDGVSYALSGELGAASSAPTRRLRNIVRLLAGLLVLALVLVACDDGPDDPCGDLAGCVLLPVTLDGEQFGHADTLAASALSAEELEPAGDAFAADRHRVALARSTDAVVPPAHLVSAAANGWFVWRPYAIAAVLAGAGEGAELISAERVNWPDSCLGGALRTKSAPP